MEETLENIVVKANSGDRKSLGLVVLGVKDYVYNLSLKMLLYPEDAEDATQEILIKIITQLSTFKSESKFKTWVYRVATNYLLNQKSKKHAVVSMSFDEYEELIDTGHSNDVTHASNDGEQLLLEEEVKVSCTQGLLLCLNSAERMVYILSEILDFNSVEGAEIMGVTSDNFRKKLSRSRIKIRHFLNKKCGLMNPSNPCRCHKKIDFLVDQDMIKVEQLRFVNGSQRSLDLLKNLGDLEKSVAIYRSVNDVEAPKVIFNNIKLALGLD